MGSSMGVTERCGVGVRRRVPGATEASTGVLPPPNPPRAGCCLLEGRARWVGVVGGFLRRRGGFRAADGAAAAAV
jgi:hypothetical protein